MNLGSESSAQPDSSTIINRIKIKSYGTLKLAQSFYEMPIFGKLQLRVPLNFSKSVFA